MSKKQLSRRDFLRLSAVAAAGTALGACAGPTPEPTEEAAVSTSPPPSEIDLTAWLVDRRTINEMTKEVMQSEFQARNPNINVEVIFTPEAEIPPKMSTAYAAGNAPDITAVNEGQLPGFLEQGFIHAIPDDLINVEEEMGSRVADFCLLEGKYYSLPNGNMPCVIFYNEDMLDAEGLTVDDIPNTWDEFIPWAKELTVWEGGEITQWGFSIVGAPWFWDSLATQKGTFMFKNSNESNLDDPLIAEAWRFVLDLFDEHELEFRNAPLGGPHERVAQEMAFTGAQFGFGAGWFPTQYPDAHWGTVTLPTYDGRAPYGRASYDFGFCMTSQKEDQAEVDAVWTLFRYLVGPDYQARYARLRGLQPSLRELYDQERFSEDDQEWRGIAQTAAPGGFRADGVWPDEVTPLIHQDLYERIVNQEEPVEETLMDHKEQIDAVVAEMELPWLYGEEGWKSEWEEA
jgi:ABC-type glycerol-3-phosphate transport system substrate-binding protein